MTNNEAVKVLINEYRCIDRNDGVNCNRKCESCDLVMDVAVLKDAYNLAIKALETQEWIPCSERLPEANGRYLVTRGLNVCGSLWNRIYIANYSDLMGIKSEKIWWQGNVGKSDFDRLDDVLAWMPLPECYREGK